MFIQLEDPTKTVINLDEVAAFHVAQEYTEEPAGEDAVEIKEADVSIRFFFKSRCCEMVVLYADEQKRDDDYDRVCYMAGAK
jgi:hypothetical protein